MESKFTFKHSSAKIFLVLMFTIAFQLSFISALEFDNKLTYKNNNKTAVIENLWGWEFFGIQFGEKLGEAELKSHNSPTEVLSIMSGKNRVVMYYDFNDWKKYPKGLGKVYFTDMRTGNKIEKGYHFAKAIYKDITITDYGENICNEITLTNGTISKNCQREIIGSHIEERIVSWEKLSTNDIPEGNNTIALITDVRSKDYIDGVWTIAGKQIKRHASWNETFDEGLISVHTFDEVDLNTALNGTFGFIYNMTENSGGDIALNTTGCKRDKCLDSNDLISGERVTFTQKVLDTNNFPVTISFWYNVDDTTCSGYKRQILFGSGANAITNDQFGFMHGCSGEVSGNENVTFIIAQAGTINSAGTEVSLPGQWNHAILQLHSNRLVSYINGVLDQNLSWDYSAMLFDDNMLFDGYNNDVNERPNKNVMIDELYVWNRTLGGTEISSLYDSFYSSNENPTITLNTPANDTNQNTTSLTFNCSADDDAGAVNLSLIIDEAINYTLTNSSANQNLSLEQTLSFAEGNYNWTCNAFDEEGKEGTAETRIFTIDSLFPTFEISVGNGTHDFGILSVNHTVNYTITETNLDTCWIEYNDTNTTIPCTTGQLNTTNFALVLNNYSARLYANDTTGNLNSSNFTWDYKVFQNEITYNNETTEGASEIFKINYTQNAGLQTSTAKLIYNQTSNDGSFTVSNEIIIAEETILVPSLTSETNVTFYWSITFSDDSIVNTTQNNQTVSPLNIDDCSAYNTTFYNFTIKDEKNKSTLSATTLNTSGKIELNMYSYSSGNLVLNFSKDYIRTNPFAVCLDNNLSSGSVNYRVDAQIQYSGNGYEEELYNIQNSTINSSSFPTEISLYDLNSTDSQIFKIIFKDASFLPVENALIEIKRKYIEDGNFEIVEIPKTDKNGKTVAHLVLDKVIYTLRVIRYGVVLATFENKIAQCQNPTLTECIIDLNSFAEDVNAIDFEEAEDFSFTLRYNSTSKIISSTFSIPSGSTSLITLNVTQEDALGTAVCTDTLTSSSGTLSCTVENSFGNSTLTAKLYKDGSLQSFGQVKLDQNPIDIYGGVQVILALFVFMTLIGIGMSNNPVYTVLFLIVGIILLYSLNLVASSGFIGATATILSIIVAIILVMIKGSRRN